MRKLLRFLPFHFSVFLILGIYSQLFVEIWQYSFYILFIIHALFLLIIGLLQLKKIRTFLVLGYFFFVGISTVFVQDDSHYSNYYQQKITKHSKVVLKVDKVLKSSSFHYKYQVKVIQVEDQKTRGIALLNIVKDSFSTPLKVDELIVVKTDFSELNAPLNPHQFDYQKYLKNQGIQQQLFVRNDDFLKLGLATRTLNGLAEDFREFVKFSIGKYNFQNDEIAVMNALLLGERREISKELLTNYSNAGAIHILAVSGLHVGIIMMLLLKFFGFLTYFKNGKTAQTILIVLILWMFAFIAGLSASVVRAVTMFSFLAIGQQFGSKKIILFSLFSSMFFLLIFKPLFLFDVGFQLSYLAVLGIITIQQKVYHFVHFKSKVIDFFWQLITVSIAAQIGVLPLSLYYFHQFPGLFFLSNLVIIPFLGFILMMGLIIVLLASLQLLPLFLANFYGAIISVMNRFVSWISHQEAFLWKDISMSFWVLLASYGCIFFGTRLLMNFTNKRVICFLVSCVFFQSVILIEKAQRNQKKEWIVFHKSKETILGFRDKSNVTFVHSGDSIQTLSSIVNSYKIGKNVQASFLKHQSNIYFHRNQPILLIDSLGIYHLQNLKNPIVLLQNSPKINLERMIKTLQPIQIIADGSNYKTYITSWEKKALQLQIPFHYTGKKGAFIKK